MPNCPRFTQPCLRTFMKNICLDTLYNELISNLWEELIFFIPDNEISKEFFTPTSSKPATKKDNYTNSYFILGCPQLLINYIYDYFLTIK